MLKEVESAKMTLYALFVITTVCSKLFMSMTHSQLIAVSYGPYVEELYKKIRNEDVPSERDSARLSASTRQRICKDITDSGVLRILNFTSVELAEIFDNRNDPSYSVIFHQLYESANPENPDAEYDNPYVLRALRVSVNLFNFQEYLFVCPLKYIYREDVVVPFYVSKEYNMNSFADPYMPGRFLFKPFMPGHPNAIYYTLVAEKPAKAYTKSGFNVELHYLRMRKYIEPVNTNATDPLCKLITDRARDLNNQHYRFCVSVIRSAYFEDKFRYPRPTPYFCSEKDISFKTAEGIALAEVTDKYSERMTLCHAISVDPGEGDQFLYISRAYQSNQVLVYRRNPSDRKVYLENLSIDVSIVDELNSFDFVED